MNRAYRCQACDGDPNWRIERRGDAVVSWACGYDLARTCVDLQRDHERTELVVTVATRGEATDG